MRRSCRVSAVAVTAMAMDASTTTVEWPSEKKKPDAERPLPILHQLARDVVDRRNVVGVDRVAQAESVREERRAEQQRVGVECAERPRPRGEIGEHEPAEQARRAAAKKLDHALPLRPDRELR